MTGRAFAFLAFLFACGAARADEPPTGWQACTQLADTQRLACFDRWAKTQSPPVTPAPPTAPTAPTAPAVPAPPAATVAALNGEREQKGLCDRHGHSALSRFWELERETSCDVFGIRGYRPISLSLVRGSNINDQPTSDNPLNNAPEPQPYRHTETRVQLSVRTKLAQGLLTRGDARDSLWFAYTQQSYWQVFTPALSRPFRSTDHEPEFMYIYPATAALAGGWQVRYAGVGLVHQSNGQSLPLSRSWNRVYLMAGAEHPGGFTLNARVWQRIHEDAVNDDNPHISDYIGRAELIGSWDADAAQTFALTLRNNLRGFDKGSVRLEWMRKIASVTPSSQGSLRFHVQLFHGYGDSLLDFNRRRTVLGVGLSLLDW
jgi:phospholipase A1